MSQKAKYIINNVLWTFLSTVLIGAMLQTFLLEKGFSEDKVGQYVSLMQFVQMSVILIFSKFVDKIKNVIRLTAVSNLLYLPMLVLMSTMCFSGSNFTLLTIFGVIAYIAVGLYNVLTYKIPYHIMDMKNYGKWTGISGGIAAVILLVLTSVLSIVQKSMRYFNTMKYFYPFATVCALIFAIMTASYKDIGFSTVTEKKKKISLLKYKPFTILILPNLIRGFCAGIIGMAVTIGYASDKLNSVTAGILIVITQTVSIPANYFYTKMADKEPMLILINSFGLLGAVSLMGRLNSTGFLICYGIAYFCLMIINVAVPVLVTRIVDYEVAGQYNGWRILLNTVGTFSASVLCVPMLKLFGPTATWIIAGLMQVISGIVYYVYCKKYLINE